MDQTLASTPEFYLSLLSGRYGDVSHISEEERNNRVASSVTESDNNLFRRHPERLLDVLDSFAEICAVNKEVFYVSMAMDSNSVTLYLSTNGTVPATAITHLLNIQQQLKSLKAVLEPGPALPNVELPEPGVTQAQTDSEMKLLQMVYAYSYLRLRRRYRKRGPMILKNFDAMIAILDKLSPDYVKEIKRLSATRHALVIIDRLLKEEEPPQIESYLGPLIEMIDILSRIWRGHMKPVGDQDIDTLSLWDDAIALNFSDRDRGWRRTLSLRRLLEKLLILHQQTRTIIQIAWSNRFSPFLEGVFSVVSVPPATFANIFPLDFSAQQDILPIAFPTEDRTAQNVRENVCNQLLDNLKVKAINEDVALKAGTRLELSPSVHAECNLLGFHLRHPEIRPYQYFGGSKLSCHACSILFSSYNSVASSFGLPKYFCRGSHNKIYLRWTFPSLSSGLEIEVKKGMINVLHKELAAYIGELCGEISRSDSTAASGTNLVSLDEMENLLLEFD